MSPRQDSRLKDLLATISRCSSEERTQIIEQLVREDPLLAAQVSLDGASLTLPNPANLGLPNRFTPTRQLGRGGFGTVYEAFDADLGRAVAIKILNFARPDALFRFKQEFRALANLRHRNLIEYYDLFEHQRLWFFTMELVSGCTLVDSVRSGNQCDHGRLRLLLHDLVVVLSWLHRHELLHRDIKPDNLLVDDSGRLVLLDFGLAHHLAPAVQADTAAIGTPAYMAPEQASHQKVTEAADWYAVGSLVYHALTGRPPFEGSVLEVIGAKLFSTPLPPSRLAPETPAQWDELCDRLLQTDPEARANAAELLDWFGDQRIESRAPSQACIGREDVLDRMVRLTLESRRRSPIVIELTGGPGFGKSALLRAFADLCSTLHPPPLILRGRCYERESVPFKALDALMDDLSRQLIRLGPAADAWITEDLASLARVFPVLGRVPAIAAVMERNSSRIRNSAELRRKAFLAFVSLLDAISADRQVIICLDDLHWGDVDSAALFQQLFLGVSVPPVAVVATYRLEERTAECLRLWHSHLTDAAGRVTRRTEVIGALLPQDTFELARTLLSEYAGYSDELARRLASDSGGNPLLLDQLAEAIRQQDAAEPRRWKGMIELIQDRLSRLPAAARDFMQMLAAVGEPLPETVVLRLAPAEIDSAGILSSLVAQNLVRRRSGEIEIQHDQIRAAIIDQIPDTARREIHRRIAEGLIAVNHIDHGLIAAEFVSAGDTTRAAEQALLAAEAAGSVLAFDRAAQFYAMSLALGDYDAGRQSSIYGHLGDAYAAAGRGGDAARAYLKAADLAESPQAGLELRRHAAEQWIRSGNLRDGILLLISLGREFNIRYIDNVAVAVGSILWSRAVCTLRGLGYRERRAAEVAPRDLDRLDMYWALSAGLNLWNPLIGGRFQLRHLRLAVRAGEPQRIGLALSAEAANSVLGGERGYQRARSLLGQALAIGNRLNDPHILGTACAMEAMSAWLTGRWHLATERGLEGERILSENCFGVAYELGVARNAMLGGLYSSGQWKTYAGKLAVLSQDARDRGDLSSFALYRMNACPVSLAANDVERAEHDLDEAESILAAAWSTRGFHLPHFFGLYGRVQAAVYKGQAAAVAPLIGPRLKALRRSFLLRIEALAILSLQMEAGFCIAAAAESATAPARRDHLLRNARRCTRQIRRKPAICSLGLAMLLDAGIEAVSGRAETACSSWNDAEIELRRVDMSMYAAAARYARGQTAGDLPLMESAAGLFLDNGVVCPVKMAAMLAPGSSFRA